MILVPTAASFLRYIPQQYPHSSKQMTVIQPPEVQWVLNLLQLKPVYSCDLLTPRVNLKKQICTSWEFHTGDRSESSSTYDMIIGNVPRSSWRIRHTLEFQ
jgi:hypothetical protein